MLTEERHDVIKALLAANGRVLAADLAVQFAISEDTVRRDLRELAKLGHCRRVYGGALSPAPLPGSMAFRQDVSADAKMNLATVAASLVRPNQTLFIDAGTTNVAIAKALPARMPLTVVTNAPAVLMALSEHEVVTTILLGGTYISDKGACVGGITVNQIGDIYADLLFLGSCGLDPVFGVSAFDPAEADVKRAMVERSAALAIAVTNDKLATAAPFRIALPSAIDHLIVENNSSEAVVSKFEALGTTIHRAV